MNQPSSIRHILIVDDDASSRLLLRGFVLADERQISEAENGIAAVAAIAQQQPDLVFMDCIMPEQDGFAATRQLRQQGFSAPIIAVTANCDEDECQAAGMDYFISKPVTQKDIELAFAFLGLDEA